jgi:hypothetical protein
LNATAGASVGAVGTYAFLRQPTVSGNAASIGAGGTLAGSSLGYSSTAGTLSGTPSGTWRCMGFMQANFDSYSNITGFGVTVWLRIS